MKRTRLKPKPHPENPYSTFAPRSKPINRMSKNKRAEKRDTDHLRRMVRTDPVTGDPVKCCVCGVADACETHEATRGTAARKQAVYRPRLQMPVCRDCHEAFDDYSEWPIERQLALAVMLLIQEANQVRGRSPMAITFKDVAKWL